MASVSRAIQRLQELADRAEPRLRQAYLDAIAQIQRTASAVRIATAIAAGDVVTVNRILMDAHLERELRKAADIIRQLTLDASRLATIQIAQDVTITASMSRINAAAVRVAEEQAARMVTRVTEQTKQAIRTVITDSVSGGLSPQQAAQQIKPLIGLTVPQAKAVQNYRARLEAAGTSAEKVTAAVERYAQKLLRLRARTIARTETMAAANKGRQELWRQMQRDGLLPHDALRQWIVTPDDQLCPVCAPLAGQTVGIDQPFDTAIGAVMNPPLHPNCRCAVALDVASLAVPVRTQPVAA